MNLVEKLKGEVERYQDKAFLKAAMAVCALSSPAAGERRLDALIATLQRLRVYDPEKAAATLDEFTRDLKTDREHAAEILRNKICRYAGQYKPSRTLLRLAFLALASGGPLSSIDRRTFDALCDILAINAAEVWGKLSRHAKEMALPPPAAGSEG